MKFVYGKAHPLVEPAWYLYLEDSDEVKKNVFTAWSKPIEPTGLLFSHLSTDTFNFTFKVIMNSLRDFQEILSTRVGWYMNSKGGMCKELYDITKEIAAKSFTDIDTSLFKISKWPEGKHYYSRLSDGTDVEIDGIYKWDTETLAKEASLRFLQHRKLDNR
jgi:hypothetical protein